MTAIVQSIFHHLPPSPATTIRKEETLFQRPSPGWRTDSRITLKVFPSAKLRNRIPSETRVAVCLICGPVFVLWGRGIQPPLSRRSSTAFYRKKTPPGLLYCPGDGAPSGKTFRKPLFLEYQNLNSPVFKPAFLRRIVRYGFVFPIPLCHNDILLGIDHAVLQ